MYYEIEKLKQACFTVEQKSPWHYQVMGVTKYLYINIWPTKRKWMVAYDSGASFYKDADDLLEIVRRAFGKKKERNPRWLVDRIQREQKVDKKAMKLWRDGLRELSTYLTTSEGRKTAYNR